MTFGDSNSSRGPWVALAATLGYGFGIRKIRSGRDEPRLAFSRWTPSLKSPTSVKHFCSPLWRQQNNEQAAVAPATVAFAASAAVGANVVGTS